MTTVAKATEQPPDAIVTRPTEDKRKINIDIAVEKLPDELDPRKKILGRSFIKLDGPNVKGTYVTDETIQIKLPDESIVRTLNLVYGEGGIPNLPDKDRAGIFSLLKDQKQHQVRAYPIESTEKSEVLNDIKAGSFDFIATANDQQLPAVGYSKASQSLVSTRNPATTWGDFHLLRTWRTGEFVTFNQKTGYIYKLSDSRGGNLGAKSAEAFRFDPGDTKWQYSFDGSVNYYKKYLIQDDVEEHEVKQTPTPKFNKFVLPLKATHKKKQKQHGLEREFSFNSETPTNSRREFPSLPRSLPERGNRARLTRSNILRHDFSQRRKLFFKLKGLPTPDTLRTMDYGKAKLFDADDALNEQNLKCPVCKNFYDTRDRAPHIMHCLHSCCDACLRTRVRAEMVQCPVCTEVHEVPNNAIELLPVDNARQHLVKYFKVKHKAHEIGCDSCDARNRATHRCRECDEFLCAVCTEAHKRTKVTKGHNIVAVENLRKSVLEEFHHKRTCPIPEHDDQHFSFYCYSKGCDIPICSLCAVTDHNKADGHDIRNINDVYIENKRLVESLMIDVKHKKNMADEAVAGIEEEIQNLYLKESATDEDIDQAFLACQKQLEKRKNELQEKLSATSKAKKKGMESQLDKLIAEKNSLEHASRFAQNVLGYSDATEFLQIKDTLYSRLGELKDTEIDTRPHNKADMKFHSHKMLDAFQKFSSKLGEVWSSTAFIPNTKIQTYDIGLGREETAMLITLHDYEKRPLAEPGVDIRVEVTNPVGKKSRAHVIDMTDTEGAYKVIYQGTKLGDHTSSVFVLGIPVIDPAVTFKVRRPGALEEDILRDYETAGMHSHSMKPKADIGSGEALHLLDEKKKIPQLSGLNLEDEGDHRQRVKSYRVFGDIICPDFSYDITTCHPQNMVTADARTLKNVRGRATNMGTALKNYRGAIGTKPFSKLGRFYFEVVVYFFIKRQLRNDLIFEVALARKPEVDRNYTVDGSPSAWTVCARRCPLCRTVCLMTFHNGVRLYHNPLTENSPPGTTLRTTIGFLVDTKAKQWYIVDAKNRRLFFRFKNIDTSKPLWPVFGAYCTEYVSVSLALKTGKDVQAVPDIPADV